MSASRPVLLAQVLGQPWALPQATLRVMVEQIANPGDPSPRALGTAGPQNGARQTNTAQVVPIYGLISHHPDVLAEMFGGTSLDQVRANLDAAMRDPRVGTILLDIDSPGGTVAGVTELASYIRSLRGGEKKIVAVANSVAASAAYWLMAQADEAIVTPSGTVGSVGIYAVHQEASKALADAGITTIVISAGPHKTEGNEWEPLTDDARAHMQERADAFYRQFIADVAKGRRTTPAQVEATYGGGQAFLAAPALAAGMVDRIATLDEVIRQAPRSVKRVMAAEAVEVEVAPLSERIVALANEAEALVEHMQEKARLRAKEGRPAFSTTNERSLRSIHTAIGQLLATVDPSEPSMVAETPPVVPLVAAPPRFRSHEEWLAYVQGELR